MQLSRLGSLAYRLSALLAVAYAVYVMALKSMNKVLGGPLGDLGECLLVLAAVSAFVIGLFVDEALRDRQDP